MCLQLLRTTHHTATRGTQRQMGPGTVLTGDINERVQGDLPLVVLLDWLYMNPGQVMGTEQSGSDYS